MVYYRVAALDAAYTTLRGRGVVADHELWMVFLCDPDAHLLAALMAERPPA